jgi:hypothetical protein
MLAYVVSRLAVQMLAQMREAGCRVQASAQPCGNGGLGQIDVTRNRVEGLVVVVPRFSETPNRTLVAGNCSGGRGPKGYTRYLSDRKLHRIICVIRTTGSS